MPEKFKVAIANYRRFLERATRICLRTTAFPFSLQFSGSENDQTKCLHTNWFPA